MTNFTGFHYPTRFSTIIENYVNALLPSSVVVEYYSGVGGGREGGSYAQIDLLLPMSWLTGDANMESSEWQAIVDLFARYDADNKPEVKVYSNTRLKVTMLLCYDENKNLRGDAKGAAIRELESMRI